MSLGRVVCRPPATLLRNRVADEQQVESSWLTVVGADLFRRCAIAMMFYDGDLDLRHDSTDRHRPRGRLISRYSFNFGALTRMGGAVAARNNNHSGKSETVARTGTHGETAYHDMHASLRRRFCLKRCKSA